MTAGNTTLEILVVDDDRQVISQLRELLPDSIAEYRIAWEWCIDFDEALQILKRRRFDLLVSDIYLGRDKAQKSIHAGDIKAKSLVDEIRESRFCPIVLFTDGQVPPDLVQQPFVWSADKAGSAFEGLVARIKDALDTGLPGIARQLHDELDRFAGSYVWKFLINQWGTLKERHKLDTAMLERIIRRRAAIQLGRLDENLGEPAERETADPVDFYIYPPIGNAIRLGEILRRRSTQEFRLVLTPHCFLVTQSGEQAPRATHVLTTRAVPVSDFQGAWKWPAKTSDDDLRKRTAFPASKVAPPEGRYCFLPGFLEIPDIYCDLFQIESIAYQTVIDSFDRIAVLDTPYAEALQASMARLYGAVGVPVLNPDKVGHLRPKV